MIACLRPARERRSGLAALGEFSMLALAMLFLSERSWKHHYVLSAFPLAFLAWHGLRAPRGSAVRIGAWIALALAAALSGLTGSGVLGARGSDLAEAYGVHLAAGLVLFAACGLGLRAAVWRAPPDEAARTDA
jgi:hypothetical protein